MLALTSRRPRRRVLVHGLIYFGSMFARLMDGEDWEFRYYPDSGAHNLASMAGWLSKCDLAYQIGGRVTLGRFLLAARALHKKKIVMHWVGSDTLLEQREVVQGNAHPWVLNQVHHWAESDWMVREVQSLGTSCELVPLPSAHVPEEPSPLPEEFSVLVYMPDTRCQDLYGLDQMLEVARQLPDINFELVGLLHGEITSPPPNLRIHGRIADLRSFYQQSSVLWRPARHDGLSFMVMEALGHGRHVLWSYPFPGTIHVSSASEAREQISRLAALHARKQLRLNAEGVQAIRDSGLQPQRLRGEIRERLERILDA